MATEMALGFRFTAEQVYEVGFLKRLVDPDCLILTKYQMAEYMLTLPPGSLVNTVHMKLQMRPQITQDLSRLATALHDQALRMT